MWNKAPIEETIVMFQRKLTDSVKIFAKLKKNAHYYFKTSGDRSEKKKQIGPHM